MISSVGRASVSRIEGQGFESLIIHHDKETGNCNEIRRASESARLRYSRQFLFFLQIKFLNSFFLFFFFCF